MIRYFHMNDLDYVEHHSGYMSPKAIETLEYIDVGIGMFQSWQHS